MDFAPQDRPEQISFLRQKSQPGLAVGDEVKISHLHMPIQHLQGFVADDHRSFSGLFSCECEVVGCGKALRFIPLEHQW